MANFHSVKTFLYWVSVFLFCGNLTASEPDYPGAMEQQIEGLWLYTGLTTSKGKDLPLNGIFLFKNGTFVQYAEYDGEPIRDQGAMAHAGPYSVGKEFVHLVAEQTFSTSPLDNPPMNSRGLTEHDVTVKRVDNELTLVFSKGTGTIQRFEYIGPGSGEIHKFENGVLALVDGYFILVHGNNSGIDTGYGTYDQDNDSLKLNIKRWTRADSSSASNIFDTSLNSTFDGQSFTLEDGRSFQVIH